MTQRNASNSNRLVAFLISIPIGILGGLIGLGGAEFRLPVLIGILKRQALEAVPINLAISLITIITSLIMRAGVISSFPNGSAAHLAIHDERRDSVGIDCREPGKQNFKACA